MDLRPESLPPPVSRQRLEELLAELERIGDPLETRPKAAGEAIEAFNAMTGHDYTALNFAEYWGSRSLEEFGREAARPARPLVADLINSAFCSAKGTPHGPGTAATRQLARTPTTRPGGRPARSARRDPVASRPVQLSRRAARTR
ncbi:hypothetical protein [Streptomyces albidocamelliae]|uniref:Uncharacterized protein n=1 Tax=Streptomyces albidocamelliae TaxID=2981135 RepID=A0ABY6EFK5_9ACTN|nr:hypothetical protein [Streptomyces sp. HUAS 14-6]UXY33273.1 hypothetical protein N8I86_00045 [Streptomyces sp. HUAS 14-6]